MVEQGIDLTGSAWIRALGEYDAIDPKDRLARPDSSSRASRPMGEADFWRRATERLALRPDAPPDADEFAEESLKRSLTTGIGLAMPQSDRKTAIAYPVGCPPILRACLPEILGMGEECAGVEAPLALALEAIGRREVDRKIKEVATITAWGDRHEVARLGCQVVDHRLTITLHDSFAFAAGELERTWRASLRSESGAEAAPTLICPKEVKPIALELARLAGWADPVVLPSESVALGAIRFAGLRGDPVVPYLGTRIRAIEWHACTARPIGLLAIAGPKREWCWRQLFPRARSLSKVTSEAVHSGEQGPTRLDPIVLADCHNPDFFEARWIAQRHWRDADLRWFTTIPTSNKDPLPVQGTRWTIQITMPPMGGSHPRLQAVALKADGPVSTGLLP